MASNDLSTTNTALDVSSVTAVSSEPVLAGTNLAGTDLAGSGADSYIFKFLTEDPRSKEYQVQVATLFDVKVPPPSPDIITLWQRLIPKMVEAAGDDEVPTRQLRLELEDRMGFDKRALRPYKVLIDKMIFEAIDAFNSAIDAEADAKRARECTASISAVMEHHALLTKPSNIRLLMWDHDDRDVQLSVYNAVTARSKLALNRKLTDTELHFQRQQAFASGKLSQPSYASDALDRELDAAAGGYALLSHQPARDALRIDRARTIVQQSSAEACSAFNAHVAPYRLPAPKQPAPVAKPAAAAKSAFATAAKSLPAKRASAATRATQSVQPSPHRPSMERGRMSQFRWNTFDLALFPSPSIVKPKKGAKGHIPYLFLFFSIAAAIRCSSFLATVRMLIAACAVLPFLFCRIVSRPALVDSALMLAGDDEVNDWDARKYPKCRPFMGKKGVQFENFVRDFGAAISSEQDDDNDLEETMLGDDIGGDNYAGPAPNAAATRRRGKRLKSLYSHLYRHVADLRLREMMHASARNDGRAAYLLLATHCRREITDLEMFDLNSEWDSATFVNTVGVSLDTITAFSRYMNGLNARRPADQRKDDDALTLKLLSCFTPDISLPLMHDAHKELRAPAAARSYHSATTGMRDYTAAVQALDEIWRSQFAAGAIKPVPRRGASGPSARVDGAAVAQDGDDTDGVLFAAPDKRITGEQLRREPNCWVCRGFGHRGADCASAKGFRPISECITVLQTILDRAPPSRGGKGKGKGTSRFGKGGGRGRAGTGGRGRFAGHRFRFEEDQSCG